MLINASKRHSFRALRIEVTSDFTSCSNKSNSAMVHQCPCVIGLQLTMCLCFIIAIKCIEEATSVAYTAIVHARIRTCITTDSDPGQYHRRFFPRSKGELTCSVNLH